jgi:hypothetical protein
LAGVLPHDQTRGDLRQSLVRHPLFTVVDQNLALFADAKFPESRADGSIVIGAHRFSIPPAAS